MGKVGCQEGAVEDGRRRAVARRRDLRCAERPQGPRRHLVADADPRGRRRYRRDGSEHGPRLCRRRRLFLRHERVRPRHPGQAPARLFLQAVRLLGSDRQRLQADVDRARCAHRDRAGAEPGHLEAGELREGELRRPLDLALRRRALAQPDDGAACAGPRHADHYRLRQALRHLRRSAARAVHVARRRRDDAACGWRPATPCWPMAASR